MKQIKYNITHEWYRNGKKVYMGDVYVVKREDMNAKISCKLTFVAKQRKDKHQ